MTMLRDDVVYKHQRCYLAEAILDNMGEGGDESLRIECIRTCAKTWRARNEQVIGLVGEKGR